ncbi:MAG TPA: hypothetical protein V6D19_10215, partial [Stenomitos sp.]
GNLQRRLYLAAGLLELADREFDTIAAEVDRYSEEVGNQAQAGDLEIEINSASLNTFLRQKLRPLQRNCVVCLPDSDLQHQVIRELKLYGVRTLADLDRVISPEFLDALDQFPEESGETTDVGVLRAAMMYADLNKYLQDAFQQSWSTMTPTAVAMLEDKYGAEMVSLSLNIAGIIVSPSSYFERDLDMEVEFLN